MKEASAAIIEATLIESAVYPHTHVEVPVEDLAEDENPMSLLVLSLALIMTPAG